MNILLKGIVGSTAYGLAGPESDQDFLGVFAAPTEEFHGLTLPVDKRATIVSKDPDTAMHEALKFVSLCLKCNPTVNELLWLPDNLYTHKTFHGAGLVDIRKAFFSRRLVRDAYLGYATQQFERMNRRPDGTFGPDLAKRTAKHSRHLLRLVDQGFQIWSTGHLDVRVKDPQKYFEFGERVVNEGASAAKQALNHAEDKFAGYSTSLPELPDVEIVEDWLRSVRKFYFRDNVQVVRINAHF